MKHLLLASLTALLGAASSLSAQGPEPDLEAIRAVTALFQDVNVALERGYVRDPSNTCVAADFVGAPPEMGAMGVHYFSPELLGIAMPPAEGRIKGAEGTIDWNVPEVLLYEPQADGSVELVGVEYLVFEEAWSGSGNAAPPAFGDRSFDRMVDDPATEVDEAHGFEPHHELHLWLYRDNPNGITQAFNPTVTCAHAAPPAAQAAPAHGQAHPAHDSEE